MTVAELLEMLAPALRDELAAIVREEVAALLDGSAASQRESWRLLSLDEVCELVGRSERQVREWAKSGELASIRLDGGALRFDLDDVRAFARSRRVGAAAELLAGRWQAQPDRSRSVASLGLHRADDRRVSNG